MAGAGKIRIIGGQWRGRKLTVRLAPELRPTPNRLRETLFNWLQPRIENADCLDLFAGTGALGLEAVSRGAAGATLIEHNDRVFKQLERQCQRFQSGNITLINVEALAWLRRNKTRFDIVFLDPPFNRGLIEKSCRGLISNRTLKHRSLVYVESEPGLDIPKPWMIKKQSRAGHVQCSLIEYKARQ